MDTGNHKEKQSYEDIIHLPHPVSKAHPQMSIHDRAAQFSPFAALTGFEGAVKERARQTERRIELSEHEKAELDEKLRLIKERMDSSVQAEITYFKPDTKKDGGTYVTVTGPVRKIDEYERKIVMENGLKIELGEIVGIGLNC